MVDVAALGVLFSLLAFGSRVSHRVRIRRALGAARSRLRPSLAPGARFGVVEGFEGSFATRVEPTSEGGLLVACQLPSALRKVAVLAPGTRTSGPRLASGDDEFDRRAAVFGPTAITTAALTEAARARLGGLVADGGSVRRGWVKLGLSRRQLESGTVQSALSKVVLTARSLAFEEPELTTRLAAVAIEDRLLSVRAVALSELLAAFPQALETDRAVEAAFRESHPRLRLLAALGPGIVPPAPEGGVPALVRRLRSTDAAVQIGAARALAEVGGPEAARELHALAYRLFTPPEVRRAAIRSLQRLRDDRGADDAGALSLLPESALSRPGHVG